MGPEFINIGSIDELESLFERSGAEPVVLFKHSNSCGTSAYIHEIMGELPMAVHVVTVQERRDISNEITSRTGILHHTPQVFVIKNGEVVYSASHYGISPEQIAEAAE
jgi:thioredoxin 1